VAERIPRLADRRVSIGNLPQVDRQTKIPCE
jgi:hypothetical protein